VSRTGRKEPTLQTSVLGQTGPDRLRTRGVTAAILVCAAAFAALVPAARAQVHETPPEYCGTNIPPDEASGFVPLPEGDVFCPLIADPKATHSFVSYVRGTSSSPLGTDLGSVGVGDRFGLMRWNGPRPGEGLQISLEGSVFAQFDLNTASYDLINADYMIGAPITFRWRGVSGRLRVYHQSSHLGDEFVLRSRIPRENLSFQSGEAMLSVDAGPLRVYAGGEHMFNGVPENAETNLLHGGVEVRQRESALRFGPLASVRMVAAGDVKAVEVLDWDVAVSARAGFEVSRAHETVHAGRRWSLLGEFYDGPSPYGQFFRSSVRYYGVGLHFSL
jgi:hypothetical protein